MLVSQVIKFMVIGYGTTKNQYTCGQAHLLLKSPVGANMVKASQRSLHISSKSVALNRSLRALKQLNMNGLSELPGHAQPKPGKGSVKVPW